MPALSLAGGDLGKHHRGHFPRLRPRWIKAVARDGELARDHMRSQVAEDLTRRHGVGIRPGCREVYANRLPSTSSGVANDASLVASENRATTEYPRPAVECQHFGGP